MMDAGVFGPHLLVTPEACWHVDALLVLNRNVSLDTLELSNH